MPNVPALSPDNEKKAEAVEEKHRTDFIEGMTDRGYVELQRWQLKNLRVTYEPTMRMIADSLVPYRLRLNLTDWERGDRRNTRMYNSTPAFNLETLENGWLSAASDPSTEWFTLSHQDQDLADWGPHREWYDHATQVLLDMLAGSNAYQSMGTCYGNSAAFGTSAMSLEESFNGPDIHTEALMTGSYWIGVDFENNVDRFYEEVRMTVRQVYDQFGKTASFSPFLQSLIDKARWEQWIDIGHMIQPNTYYNPGLKFSENKPYASWWFEIATGTSSGQTTYVDPIISMNKFLRRGGFDTFPIIVDRYEVVKGEAYGVDCPGMKTLGDMNALQIYEKRIASMVEKTVNPHWIAPSGLMGQADHGFTPGLTTYMPSGEQNWEIKPAHVPPPQAIQPAMEKLNEILQRHGKGFSTDLFQLFDSLPDKQRTATEVMQRKSEKLLKLGKRYLTLQHYKFRAMINRLFQIAVRRGKLKPAPLRIQGEEIAYKFNGILAQAQKMAKFSPISTAIQEFSAIAEQTGQAQSPIWDLLNLDKIGYHIGDTLQLPADMINGQEKVQALRQQKAQQAAQQQKLMMAESASKSVKNLGQAQTKGGESNALDDVVGALSGRGNAA